MIRKIPQCMTSDEPDLTKKIAVAKVTNTSEMARFTNTEEGTCPVCKMSNAPEHLADERGLGEIHQMVPAEANGISVLVCLEHKVVIPLKNEERY